MNRSRKKTIDLGNLRKCSSFGKLETISEGNVEQVKIKDASAPPALNGETDIINHILTMRQEREKMLEDAKYLTSNINEIDHGFEIVSEKELYMHPDSMDRML